MNQNIRQRRFSCKRKAPPEGAAMLVVMMMLLMLSTTAIIAVRTAQTELRMAGSFKRRGQAARVSSSSLNTTFTYVDEVSPGAVIQTMKAGNQLNTTAQLDLTDFEAPLAPSKEAFRIYPEDMPLFDDPATSTEIETYLEGDLFGARTPYTPGFVVDLYDTYEFSGIAQGKRVDGRGKFKYLKMTYTARGFLQLPTGSVTNQELRKMQTVRSTARAYAISGPFAL